MAVQITGDKQLEKVFDQFEVNLRKKIARKAIRKAAKPVRDTAIARAPVDTGLLKKSIKVRAMKRSRKNKHTVAVRVVTGEGFFKGEAFYGGFLEYGTTRMRARPFMRPAHDENKNTVRQVFQTEIAALVIETARESK